MVKNKKLVSTDKTKPKTKASHQVKETSAEYIVIKRKSEVSSSQSRGKRKGLTSKELERQDFVDGMIFELINALNPSSKQANWDIEMIGDIRDRIQFWLVEHYAVATEKDFYPFIPE
jgi:hypothetical protein